jgi:hypothetical protein
LEHERVVYAKQSNHRGDERRIGMAIRNEYPDWVARHHGLFRRSRRVGEA